MAAAVGEAGQRERKKRNGGGTVTQPPAIGWRYFDRNEDTQQLLDPRWKGGMERALYVRGQPCAEQKWVAAAIKALAALTSLVMTAQLTTLHLLCGKAVGARRRRDRPVAGLNAVVGKATEPTATGYHKAPQGNLTWMTTPADFSLRHSGGWEG